VLNPSAGPSDVLVPAANYPNCVLTHLRTCPSCVAYPSWALPHLCVPTHAVPTQKNTKAADPMNGSAAFVSL
jgi:hypothetical protein